MPIPLQFVVDSLDAVPEALREHYEEKEGKFHLVGVEDTGALKRALENAKSERAKAKSDLEKLRSEVDPEEYARLKDEATQREQASIAKKGEWDKLKEQMITKHQSDLAAKDNEVSAMRSALESYLIDAEATRALAALHMEHPMVLLPHMKMHIKVMKEDGQYFARVVDKDGNPRIGNAAGEAMTMDELAREMRNNPAFAPLFPSTGTTGGGASTQTTRLAGGSADLMKLKPVERMNAVRAQKAQT